MTEREKWWLLVVLVLGACAMLATTMVSDGLGTVLATVVAVSELTALYVLYQREQRRLRWIHELYWARNQEHGRFFRDEYDGEVEAEFVCRTTAREAFVGWLGDPEVRARVLDVFRAGTAHQLSFTTGFLEVIYRDDDMVKDKVEAALSVLERLAISLERGPMPASGGG